MTLLNKMVASEAFIQGKYLSVGINSSGNIGTRYAAPVGFNTDISYQRVGLLADLDGFGTGKAALRDATVRGAPIEGFNIGYKIGASTYIQSNQEMAGLTEIAGKASSKVTTNGSEANWNGATTEKLGVDQKITLVDDARYIRFEVTLKNNSASDMADLHYMRTVNPALAAGEEYVTSNKIVKQGSDGALITATTSATSATSMFLYANDDRAVVSSYGFIVENPYNTAATIAQKVGTVTKGDSPLNINFALGTLGAGESTSVVFYMGVTDTLTDTIAEIDAQDGGVVVPWPSNTAPEAVADALTIVSGETGKGNLLANDKDANGDALTATLKAGPKNGTVTLAADGSFVYKAAAGYVGADSFTYTASDGKASSAATVSLTVKAPVPTNTAPTAIADALTIVSGETGIGNVLTNDKDANGDALTAALKSGPAHGTVTLAADGSFVYKAAAGYAGADSFTYTASDGKAPSAATVSVTVNAPPKTYPGLPDSDLVQRAGTVDGSASASATLSGIDGHNSFYFDYDAKSGVDRIANFDRDDVLVLDTRLADGNGDGIISLSKSKLSLGDGDKVTITGVSSLRYLGTDEDGLSAYANAAVKPKGVTEGTIGDDSLVGGLAAKKSVFFFDTGLDIQLGDDRIDAFDTNDLIVTTTALRTTALDKDGAVALTGASGELGSIDFNTASVGGLEFDGSLVRSGVTYYVYSQTGSAVGLADLNF